MNKFKAIMSLIAYGIVLLGFLTENNLTMLNGIGIMVLFNNLSHFNHKRRP